MIRIAILGLIFVPCTLIGQQIASISIEGLKKTKASYVQQFIQVAPGEVLDSAQLDFDKNILTNLEMFNRADYEVTQRSNGEYDVTFVVDELFTLLPIFSFGGIAENFWIQAGITEVNLGGRGNKLTTYYQYYDRSSVATHLTLERIKQSNWGINFDFVKWSTLEPLFFEEGAVNYEYDNWTFGTTGVRYFKYRDKLEFGGAYFTEDYSRVGEAVSGAPVSPDVVLNSSKDRLEAFTQTSNPTLI